MKNRILRYDFRNGLLLSLLLAVLPLGAQPACPAAMQPDTAGVVSDSVVMAFLEESGVPVSHNNEVVLLESGREKFENLFAAIATARHHIHLEYFNFRNDSVANALFGLLARKADEGVEVRALFDAFGNWSNNRPLKNDSLKALRRRGIEIVKFDPIRFPYLNHVDSRDHRKIVVIDGSIGYTGGMNVADYYVNGLPEIGPWRDMHVRIEGDAVAELQRIFLDMWNKTTDQSVGGDPYFPLTGDPGAKAVAIVDRAPRKCPKQMRRTYVASIRAAQEKIQIVNPYFLPTRSVKRALKDALKRGVRVEIMLSAKSDISFTPDGSYTCAYRLMKRGAAVYLYTEGFHHSKIMMVDDAFCTVGSTNLDSRSLRYDYEVNAFVFDEETTDSLVDLFETDKGRSMPLTKAVWKKRSGWRKFVGWTANLLTPFL